MPANIAPYPWYNGLNGPHGPSLGTVSDSYALTVVNGAAWIPADLASGYGGYAPAGFTDFSALFQYFGTFNMAPYVGALGLTIPADGNTADSPQFGLIYFPGLPLNFGLNFGFLYLPIALSAMGRQYLLQSITGLSLGPNVNPLLSQSQISQNGLQFVAISLDSSQRPQSSGSAKIEFYSWLTIDLVPFTG